MIQLIDEDDVKTRKNTKKEPKTSKIDNNEKITNDENISKNKKYQFWRWKIKRILIDEKIIDNVLNWKTVLDIFDPIIDNLIRSDTISIKEILTKQRSKLREHHTKYKEIHGEDKTTFISMSKHVMLHQKLRKEGKCNILPKELARISQKANARTQKYMRKHPKKRSFLMIQGKLYKITRRGYVVIP